jgi:hypothetical protein
MSLSNILQIRDIIKQDKPSKSVANYMINQVSYNFPSVIKTGTPSEVEEMLNAIDEIYELYQGLK